MAHTSRAWLLDIGDGWRVAAGAAQVVEYLLEPETLPIPLTPRHCAGLMLWRDRMIPVIDLAPVLGNLRKTTARRAIILAYQEAPGQTVHHGGLLVEAAPVEIRVSDDMAGPLPEASVALRHFTQACFLHHDRAVPVIDACRLFTRSLPIMAIPADEPGKPEVEIVDDTLVHHIELMHEETPRHFHVAMNVAMWKSFDAPSSVPAAPSPHDESPESAASEHAIAAPYCVVIPFTPWRAEPIRPEQSGIAAPLIANVPTPPEVSAPQSRSTDSAAGCRDGEAGSVTMHSLQRLRDMERRQLLQNTPTRTLWVVATGALLVTLVLAVYLFSGSSGEVAAPVASDASPSMIHPVSVPSAPTQPPH